MSVQYLNTHIENQDAGWRTYTTPMYITSYNPVVYYWCGSVLRTVAYSRNKDGTFQWEVVSSELHRLGIKARSYPSFRAALCAAQVPGYGSKKQEE